jgi:phage FluMu gp28-like protein
MSDLAPAVLLPYQQKWIADESAVKIMEKSRRVGLSWAEAADDALTGSLAKDAGGDDTWYIGYNQDLAKEFILDVGFWAKHYGLAASEMEEAVFVDEDKDIVTYCITFASGFRVTALSSRPSNLRGKQGRVVIDEAAFHDDLDGLIKAAMALLMWGGRVRIISTHDGDKNPFNELILACRANKLPYSVHRIEFKEAVRQGLFRRICLTTKKVWSPEAEAEWAASMYKFYGEHASEELDVIPGTGQGTYLSRALIESCMQPDIPVLRLKLTSEFTFEADHIRQAEVHDWCEERLLPSLKGLDATLHHYFGEDFARSGDLSVFWPLAETKQLKLITPFIIELRNVPFEQQRQILHYMIDRLPRFQAGAMDARGNGSWLAEVTAQKYGADRIATVMLTTEWYRENMPPLKAAFEDRDLVVPRDADVLADLRAIKLDKGVAKVPDNAHTKGEDGHARHGDSAIALALANYAALRMEPSGGVCEGFQSIARRGSAGGDNFDTRSRSMM